MRYVFGFWFALALGLALMAGCSDENGEGGSGGTAGTGGMAGMGGAGGTGGSGGMAGSGGTTEFPCTEQGIRDAIAEGGGPHFFACDGPTTVVTDALIVIDNEVILDGEGNLTVDGNEDHPVLLVARSAELRGFTVTGGRAVPGIGGGIECNLRDGGTLTIVYSTIRGNTGALGGGIGCVANPTPTLLTLINSTISDNRSADSSNNLGAGGIWLANHSAVVINSTLSGNAAASGGGAVSGSTGGVAPRGTLMMTNSTVSENTGGPSLYHVSMTLMNTLLEGDCAETPDPVSLGHNIESPGDTCGFDQSTDQVNVNAARLSLGLLRDNGGPTETHALLPGSVAIDVIPEVDCVDADDQPLTTDQRGEPRPETGGTMCDVGAFEAQP